MPKLTIRRVLTDIAEATVGILVELALPAVLLLASFLLTILLWVMIL